jgi:DNA polymerase III epsilon subunit-like protein
MNTIIAAPTRPTLYLVFDVETNGLLPKGNVPLDQYPHVLQLSFALYNMNLNKVVSQYDSYIKVDSSVLISEFISNLTGITHELCQEKGRPMLEALRQFHAAYLLCDVLIAHNLEFDKKMIMVEMERNRGLLTKKAPECFVLFNAMYESVHGIDQYCTMQKSIALCNLPMPEKVLTPIVVTKVAKKPAKKYPKLIELFQTLFPSEPLPLDLHNSMTDVMVCLKCYLKMRHNIIYV